ncbi:MAG: glycosyltransferase family 2 protein [Desulfovibrio sp.]|jgi:glycosyltransferase involved in cell wall biosynthesis|nr:glycosyltransferase family 2 protein [Desulfovibrio sp.]
MKLLDLTVIVCTYNRGFILGDCLGSLAVQTVPSDMFHVLVINNNSTDDSPEVAAGHAANLPGFRIVDEPRQGLACARNRGLAEARTEWVAFLDDDARAHPGWVAAILDTIGKNDFDCFGGPYHAWHRFGPAPGWFDPAWETYAPAQPYGPLGEAWIPGGNCALRKEYALAAGGFPEQMGMTGKKCAYGEEIFLFERMENMGRRLGFVPDMTIDHCVLPYKYGLCWRLKSGFAVNAAWARIPANSPSARKVRRVWMKLFFKQVLLSSPLRFWRSAKSGQPWKRVLFETFNPIFGKSGYALTLTARYIKKLFKDVTKAPWRRRKKKT